MQQTNPINNEPLPGSDRGHEIPEIHPHARGRDVFHQEAAAINAVASRLGGEFDRAIAAILACQGRVVLTGMGKHGLIARKIASTMASTGTLSLFLDPAEGRHGDLGMVAPEDVVIAVSNSGGTDEVLQCLPFLKRNGNTIIAMTGKLNSELARQSDIVLDIAVDREACPLNLAPTTSTTVALAMGDALAVVLLDSRNFRHDDFALRHPAGTLGRRLLRVCDLVRSKANPVIAESARFKDAVTAITKGAQGAVSITGANGTLSGVLTDGDVRRAWEAADAAQQSVADVYARPVSDFMTRSPMTISPDLLALEALALMEDGPRKVMQLPVVDGESRPVGMLHLHDLVSAGI